MTDPHNGHSYKFHLCLTLFLVSTLSGTEGFEVVSTNLAALNYDFNYCNELEDRICMSWLVIVHFKTRHGVLDCYIIPVTSTTKLGIQFYTWMQKFVNRLDYKGRADGWAFIRPNGDGTKATDNCNDIFSKLERIQATTNLIDLEYKRCGMTTGLNALNGAASLLSTPTKIYPSTFAELKYLWQTDIGNRVLLEIHPMGMARQAHYLN